MTEPAVDGAPLDVDGSVAVVTGGAGGIGRALGRELLRRGATLVIADVENGALDLAVAELAAEVPGADVRGVVTDVTDEASTAALADEVWRRDGRCDLLFLNAGVTSGGGGMCWEQEPNDWRWCFGVNVIGLGIGIGTFVPRMLAGGHPGQIVVTSSKDGGVAPVPRASVYAASKAAVSCVTESLQHQLVESGSLLRASVFYPSGGLLDTGLFSSDRNRPASLARVGKGASRRSMSFGELVDRVTAARGERPPIADLEELASFVLDGVVERRFIIARELDVTARHLRARADSIERAELPPAHQIGV